MKSWHSLFNEDDRTPDGGASSCKANTAGLSSASKSSSLLDSLKSPNAETLCSKYGESNKISGSRLRKLRRGSH